MSVDDKVRGEDIRAIEIVGQYGVCVIAAAVKIEKNGRNIILHQLVDILVGKLTEQDKPIDLAVTHGIRYFTRAVRSVLDYLQHSVIVLLLQQLDEVFVHYPIERRRFADKALCNDDAYIIGKPVVLRVTARVSAVSHFGGFLLDTLAERLRHALTVTERL